MRSHKKMVFSGILFIACIFLIIALFTYGTIQRKVSTSQKVLFLTFDDGPGPYTSEVLDVLAQYNVSATFFLLGERAQEQPELVLRMLNEGHALGSHSYTHKVLWSDAYEEISKGRAAIESITNTSVYLFRAPYGAVFPHTLRKANQARVKIVSWSCFPRDYSATQEVVVHRVTKCFSPGEIIVLHAWNHPQSVKALPQIIEAAREEGYRFTILQ